jgi:hypothetical protein
MKKIILLLVVVVFSLFLLACNIFDSDRAKLIINIITENDSSIIAENIFLLDNADTSQIFTGKRLSSNKIEFTNLKYGSYSLYIGTQVFDDNIRVFANIVTRDITVDISEHEYRVTTFQNLSDSRMYGVVVVIENFDDTHSLTEVEIPIDLLAFGGSHNLVVMNNSLIKHVVYMGSTGIYSIRNITQDDVVFIHNGYRPYIAFAFCSQAIGSATGEVDIFYNEDGIAQIGIKSFDQIACEFMIFDLIRNRRFSVMRWELGVTPPSAGAGMGAIYPLNIFGILTNSTDPRLVDALLSDDSILAVEVYYYIGSFWEEK